MESVIGMVRSCGKDAGGGRGRGGAPVLRRTWNSGKRRDGIGASWL